MDSGTVRRSFSAQHHPVVVKDGCSCRRTRSLVSLFTPKTTKLTSRKTKLISPQSQPNRLRDFSSSTTNSTKNQRNSSSKSAIKTEKTRSTRKRVVDESVAVVKESQDPYHDFRDSMLRMILEKELYRLEDLRELLHRFLDLNSSCHHEVILNAFSEIWNEIFAGGKVYVAGWKMNKQIGLPH